MPQTQITNTNLNKSHIISNNLTKINSNKNNSYLKTLKTKDSKTQYIWGLGIEHEFAPVIKFSTFEEYAQIHKILYDEDLDLDVENIRTLKKEMELIKSKSKNPITFHYSIQISYNYDAYGKEFPFSNIEFTGDKYMLMLETKNMKYQNVSLPDLLKELNYNTQTIFAHYNGLIKKKYGAKLNGNEILKSGFKESNEGSIFYLYHIYTNAYVLATIINTPKYTQDIKLGIDTSGSYHFWITLPYKKMENKTADYIKKYNRLHQNAAYLLQIIEPLLVAIYCSPDPRVNKTNKDRLICGSFRGAVNRFANYGTSPMQDYEDPRLKNRLMELKYITQPVGIDSNHYIFQIRNKYFPKINAPTYTDMLKQTKPNPKYMYLNNSFDKEKLLSDTYNAYDYSRTEKKEPTWIGLNIRRREEIQGFEFRIMDHIPEKELGDLAKVVYLIACMSYEITGNALTLASSNQYWHTMMANALMQGNRCKVEPEYVKYLETQFEVSLISSPKNIIALLEDLVNKCWKKTTKYGTKGRNKLWMLLGKDMKKPQIISKNKEILDKLLS